MIDSLTTFRFFAALGVYFHHLNYSGGLGSMGVSFFFVLSGFILSYNYYGKFLTLNTDNILKFILYRFARVYPVHILTFIISLPIIYFSNIKFNLLDTLLNIFLLQSYFPNGNKVFSFNAVSWTISVEMVFYAFLPFILFFLYKAKIMHNIKNLFIVGSTFFLIAIIIAFMFRNEVEAFSLGWWFIYIFPLFRLVDFIIGVLLGLIFISVSNKKLFEKKDIFIFSFLEIASILTFVFSYYSKYYKFDSISYSLYYIPSISLIIFIFAFQRGIFSSLLSYSKLVYLGEISYSMYMIHQLAITYFARYFFPTIYGESPDIRHNLAQTFVLLIIIYSSSIIYRFYEFPLRKRIRKAADNFIREKFIDTK